MGGKGKDGKVNDYVLQANVVCIKGLPSSTKEGRLKKYFTECGEIVSCKLLLHDDGNCKGIAFIKFASEEGCEAAMKLNETDYRGRSILVSLAGDRGKGKDGKSMRSDRQAKN